MGKSAKKKTTRNAQKEKQFSLVVNGVSASKEARVCPHLDSGINLDKVSSKITSLESHACDDCRENVVERKSSRVKGKHGKKKGGGSSKSMWVCLACGEFTCGGVGFPTTPQSHATRHFKKNSHPLAINFANPNLRFCFPCNTLIPLQKTKGNEEQKDAFSDIVKVIKTQRSSENSLDVENVWFQNGSVKSGIKLVNSLENYSGDKVKGLTNLGNTCFFNAILQSLLSMDKLKDYFLTLEEPFGPLSISLKELFIEVRESISSKNVINPRPLFNSVCAIAPQFKGYQQQDSHELLRFLLDGLFNEEKSLETDSTLPKHDPTFIDSVFGGQISSSVSCLECGYTSIVYEPYLDLSLPLPIKKSLSKKKPLVSRSKKQKPPLKKRGKLATKVNKASNVVIEKFSEITIKESVVSSDNFLSSNGNTKVDSSDFSSWLDYVDPTVSSDDVVADDSWLDYLEPCSSSNDHTNTIVAQSFANGDEVFQEDEVQVKVQESEVLLLPYKELEQEQEPLDFDGFGGLFDEPEVVCGPTLDPFLNGVVENESESDYDEVDNVGSPVSVEKCLSFFTTSEVLTKTEHAWQCEQCSKALLEQKTKLKNKLKDHVSHGVENGVPNTPNSDETSCFLNDTSDCNQVAFDSEVSCSVQDADSCNVNKFEDNCEDEKVQKRQSRRLLAKKRECNGVEDDDSSVKVIRDACKRILIDKIPPILTIHLKRLSQDARGRLSKLNGHVDFEDTIDLTPYMDPRDGGTYRYRLTGVVEHIGTMKGGHYVAYVRRGAKGNNDDCIWYHASDDHVQEVSIDEVFRCEAYILFYEQM